MKKNKLLFCIYFLILFGLCFKLKTSIFRESYLLIFIFLFVILLYSAFYFTIFISKFSKTEATIVEVIYKPRTSREIRRRTRRESKHSGKIFDFRICYLHEDEQIIKVQSRIVYKKYKIGEKLTILHHSEHDKIFFIDNILIFYLTILIPMLVSLFMLFK